MRSVYFVVQREYLQERHAVPLELVGDIAPEQLGGVLLGGVAGWVIKTCTLLRQEKLSFRPVLTNAAPPGEVCVFHYDHARPKCGVHRCFAVVVQADRPNPPLADLVVTQSRASQDAPHKHFIPYWPQHGLIPRDPSRGSRLENVAFMGIEIYLPDFFNDPVFQKELTKLGMKVIWRSAKEWHNYSDVDVVLAMRHLPPAIERTKPASKLVNAWLAGVPAILSPEPAFREQRQSELDYLEANNASEAIAALYRLKNSPELYQAMIANGRQRGLEFEEAVTKKAWVALLEKALQLKESSGPRIPALRWARYYFGKHYNRIWKRVVGWPEY